MTRILLVLVALIAAGCATTGGIDEDAEPTVIEPVPESAPESPAVVAAEDPKPQEESKQQEGEVPLPYSC